MARKQKQHDRQFKLDALQYVREHPDLTQEECCKNLGITLSTLARWKQQYEDSNGDIPFRGSGNYSSDEQKEIARLKREWLNRFRIESYNHANRLVFEYIEAFYNTVRIHSHCNYMSPEQFEQLYARVAA